MWFFTTKYDVSYEGFIDAHYPVELVSSVGNLLSLYHE